MLEIEELLEIEEIISEKLEQILIKLNRTDKLGEFLELIGMSELLGTSESYSVNSSGIILVIGKCEVKEEKLAAVAKKLGINKDRFEFYLDYEDAKSFNFKKTQWSDKYSVILVGQMPHIGASAEGYNSIISALECQTGYPPVVRVGMDELKITKSSFKSTLEELIQEKKIA